MTFLKKICFISILITTACTTTKPPQELSVNNNLGTQTASTSSEINARKNASSITSWEMSGAIAAKNQQKGWSASINWIQYNSNQYQIRLMGPLGGSTIIIEKKGSHIIYRDGSKSIASTNAEELLQKQTGVRLPVRNLFYWVRGLPAPGQFESYSYDAAHHLNHLKQSGFNITCSDYTYEKSVMLPQKVIVQGNGVIVKLIIRKWNI
jgi:outer membrane lipoprotein LolB